MRLARRFALLAVAAALLGGTAALATSPVAVAATAGGNQGWVRCANLSPGPPVQVYLYPFGNPGHPIMLRHQGYGGVADYVPVTAGQYTVAMRPVGAPASSPPSVSTSFMVSAGTNYTVARLGSATAQRLKVLTDQMAGAGGSAALVRVIQASLKQPQVTVSVRSEVLARQLAFGSATSYQSIQPGSPTVMFSAPGGRAAKAVPLAAGSVYTIAVLDGASGLKIDCLTDAAGTSGAPHGGAATGLGGTAPGAPFLAPWLTTLTGGLLLAVAGGFGLRRSRRVVTGADQPASSVAVRD